MKTSAFCGIQVAKLIIEIGKLKGQIYEIIQIIFSNFYGGGIFDGL